MDVVDSSVNFFDSEGETIDERSDSCSQFLNNTEEGLLTCERCGRQGFSNAFYGKKKQYCSFSCSRPSLVAKKIQQKKNPNRVPGSFDWRTRFDDTEFLAGPVSSFRFAPLSEWWARNVTVGMKVEVQNYDSSEILNRVVYWVATIEAVNGYFVKLRYVGYEDNSEDFWANLCSVRPEDGHLIDHTVHHVGWCALNEKPLVPPKAIENKTSDWRGYMVQKLTGSKTLPHSFSQVVQEKLKSRLEIGMKLEAVDKTRLSSLRVAIVHKIIGRRLNVRYERMDEDDDGFWFHEKSPMIHPVGWARLHGHELLSTEEYARSSLNKVLNNQWGPKEATWNHLSSEILPEPKSADGQKLGFAEGMKLEVIDPLNLSLICIGTVHKILRNNYLMIGIDGATHPNGSDLMCYHATSPYIFPAGFCKSHDIPLQPPNGYKKKEFVWGEYLEESKSKAAPRELFRRIQPEHQFAVGHYIEAVDLMDPKLICVARITRIVDRLLRIHFEGWDVTYDQWIDCDSPDIFPVGWCEIVDYLLTPPPIPQDQLQAPAAKRKKESSTRKKRRKMKIEGQKSAAATTVSPETSVNEVSTTSIKTEISPEEEIQQQLTDIGTDDFLSNLPESLP